jgi:alpha-D-xyloside xylohydrolase
MKFEQGQWLLLPGIQAIYPLAVVDVRTEPDALTITGYDHVILSRDDYHDGVAISVRFTSPMSDVIRVQITHFKGRREHLPVFDLDYTAVNPAASIGRDDQKAWLKTGHLSVVAPVQGEWGFTFYRDDQPLTNSGRRAIGLFKRDGKTYLREQLALNIGETVYGLGEHFGPFVKNGQAIDMWNEDGGTCTEYTYKNVPFYLTNHGYGVLVNHPGRVAFEVGSHHVNRVQFSVEGHSLDYYIFGGPTPKEALEQYTALSGRPALPPAWSFGLWLSTSFITNYNEQDILANIARMEDLGIPIGVFHFDCFWMKELTWCSFLWDERHFPDPVGMLRRIKDKGIRVCVWINPYISQASPLFDEGAAQSYFLRTPDGDVYQVDQWQPGMAFVDFTNPAARAWYADKLKALIDMGVDTFKTDFGERIPADAQ